jgi:hypothetical protein
MGGSRFHVWREGHHCSLHSFLTANAFPWHFHHHRRDDTFNGREFPIPPRRRPDLRPFHPAHLVAPGRTSSRPVAPRAAPVCLVTPRLPAPRPGRLVHSSSHPNREEALRELEALGNQMLARLGGVFEHNGGPREDARELQSADYQRIRDVCGLDMTKELSFTRYKGHEQATAIANIKAEYPWMSALEAKAALVKAVSGYKHEATKVVHQRDDVVLAANTSDNSLGKSSGVRRVLFGGVRNFGFGSSINGFGFSERLAADKEDDGSSDVEGSLDSDQESTSDSSDC